jgi:hypothetical protein
MTDEQKYQWHLSRSRFFHGRYNRTMTAAGLSNLPAAYRVKRAPLKARRFKRLASHHLNLSYQY